jgi:hypothetical protein
MYSQVRTVTIFDTPRAPAGGQPRRAVYRVLLMQGAKSSRQLAKDTGLSPVRVRAALKYMRWFGDIKMVGGRYMVTP